MSVRSDTTKQKDAPGLIEKHHELLKRAKESSSRLSEGWRSGKASQQNLSEQFINMLAPIKREGLESASEELSVLNRLTSAIAESVEQGIISEEEAESLLRHALSNFVKKRLEEVVNDLFSESRPKWFLAASHHFHERKGK